MACDYEAAAEQLEKTLELDPFFSRVRETLAEIYSLDEKLDQAISIVRESKPKLAHFYQLIRPEKNSEASAFLATTTDVEVPLSRRALCTTPWPGTRDGPSRFSRMLWRGAIPSSSGSSTSHPSIPFAPTLASKSFVAVWACVLLPRAGYHCRMHTRRAFLLAK